MNTRTVTLLIAAAVMTALIASVGYGNCGTCGKDGKDRSAIMAEKEKAAMEKVKAAGLGYLTANDLKAKLASEKPPVVVDVLDKEMYQAKHIKGAINVPVADIEKSAPTLLPDKSAEIVVYCAGYECPASIEGGKKLKELGYTNVSDFKGGLKVWKHMGLPLEGEKVKK